jgi:hypothetical protein
VVLSVAYALLAAVLSGRMAGLGGPSKPGAAARPVGIYDPYDADGCADCACHGKALCEVRLSVAREMKQPLMLQFQLEAFYQNHRRYLNSVSHAQLSRSSLEQQSSALDYEVPPPRPACRTRLAPAPHPLRNRSAPAPHPLRTRRAAARAAAAHPRAPLPPERTRARARALMVTSPPSWAQDLADDCAPLVSPNGSSAARPYDPCGVKAASLFNDYVQLFACVAC